MASGWTRLGSAARYTRGKLTLREDAWRLPDGQEVVYPVLHAGVGVAILPFIDESHVLLVGQYRHLFDTMSWELPGGGALPGEEPVAAAQRELREEGGYRAAPVEKEHSSEASQVTSAATSSGRPTRPMGTFASSMSTVS